MTTAVGVDLGGTKVLARLVDTSNGWAEGRSKLPTPKTGIADVLDAVVEAVNGLDGLDDAAVVGIGVPGWVVGGNRVMSCPNIEGWTEPVDVGTILAERLGRPVVVANDVNCGAVAEHRLGAGKGSDDLLTVFVGTGVGGGLILGGRIVEGERGLAGEIGHLTVEPGGRLCGCGGRGHLEAYAGKAGLERRARELAESGRRNRLADLVGSGSLKSRHLASALEEGDEVAIELLAEAVQALAMVIGNVATMVDVPQVVLGGGVVDKLGQDFVNQIASSPAFGGLDASLCELRLAERLDDAGVAGAALLASDRFG